MKRGRKPKIVKVAEKIKKSGLFSVRIAYSRKKGGRYISVKDKSIPEVFYPSTIEH